MTFTLIVPDDPSPGTSLLKVNHYENRVTSLNIMLAHHSKPCTDSVEPENSPTTKISLEGSSPNRSILDDSIDPGSKHLQSLADADLNGSISDSDDNDDNDLGMEVPAIDFSDSNDPDPESGNFSFSFDATETVEPPTETPTPQPATNSLDSNNPDDESGNYSFAIDATETAQNGTATDASEAQEASSSDQILNRIRSAVIKDHDYVKVDTTESGDLGPPSAKIPRLDSGS